MNEDISTIIRGQFIIIIKKIRKSEVKQCRMKVYIFYIIYLTINRDNEEEKENNVRLTNIICYIIKRKRSEIKNINIDD